MEQSKPSRPTDSTVIMHRPQNIRDYSAIPLDRNTNLMAETASATSLDCGKPVNFLMNEYLNLIQSKNLTDQENISMEYELGKGGQGIVFYCKSSGSDNFQVPVALKFFSPEGYKSEEEYEKGMMYNAKVLSTIGAIQHDNLLAIRNWYKCNNIQIMEMEWIDGYDLYQLMKNSTIEQMQKNLPKDELAYRMEVVISPGKIKPRLKTGVALTIIRRCLDALSALHEHSIAHGDIKPANIMLKKIGGVKIIDYGSTIFLQDAPSLKFCTPLYAAPELLIDKSKPPTPQSDLASLGYVLIELLSGQVPFNLFTEDGKPISTQDLIDQKISLVDQMEKILPEDIQGNSMLVNCLIGMVHPDLRFRFHSAKDAIINESGVGRILRSLVEAHMVSEFDLDIMSWIRGLNL
ncbi:MAG: protein kinase [Thermoguttaceae bacterium]|nr:protein kinase [Thermoguttaceae bacterium]MDO4858339.1 protein kinase [Thermoguttaceae bacterium]